MTARRLAGTLLAATFVVGILPATARAYPWPVKPFERAHPVRAVVGDPRTTFLHRLGGDPLAGPGLFSFHDGVDIDASSGTPVYPVVSGIAAWYKNRTGVEVTAADGRRFIYMHIAPLVRQGQTVTAQRTVLGRVHNWAQELHFTELSTAGGIVNPLLPGHLAPYRDTTQPIVSAVITRDVRGNSLDPFEVHGRVTFIAKAYDSPMPVLPRAVCGFASSSFARDGFSVVPAVVTWSLSRLSGRSVVPRRTVVDFRRGIPLEASFWRVYARGTYQNRAPIVPRYHKQLPGRFLFTLTPSPLDTRGLHDGVYVLTVTAIDVRGNEGTLAERIEIRNRLPGR